MGKLKSQFNTLGIVPVTTNPLLPRTRFTVAAYLGCGFDLFLISRR